MNDYLPPIDSAHATQRFREQGIVSPILIISMSVEAEQIRHSFEHGANGYMQKAEMGEHLVNAVRTLHQGHRYLSPQAEEALSN
jgi:two-component system response regulator DegU